MFADFSEAEIIEAHAKRRMATMQGKLPLRSEELARNCDV